MQDSSKEENLLDWFCFFYERKSILILVTSFVTLIFIIYALNTKKLYKSQASLMPISDSELSGRAMPSILTGIGLSNSDQSSESQKLIILLQSRTLADHVFEKLKTDLLPRLHPELWDQQKKDWKVLPQEIPEIARILDGFKERLKVDSQEKPGLVVVSFISEDPALAKKILTTYLDELYIYANKLDLYKSQRELRSAREQLKTNNRDLLTQGAFIKRYYSNQKFDENKIVGEVAAFSGVEPFFNDGVFPISVYLDYLINRQKTLIAVNAALEQSYQQAKLIVEREKLGFQIIDEPDLPTVKIFPKTRKFALGGLLAGFSLSLLIVFVKPLMFEVKQRLSAVETGKQTSV